jgi:release factor glutamine methyltransferase
MGEPPISVSEALRSAVRQLRESGSRSPRLDAELLLATALGVERTDLLRAPERELTFVELRRFQDYIERRAAHEPVAYIRRRRAFRTLELEVSPAVLIPRPETETLVDVALEALAAVLVRPGTGAYEPVALDVGTGSGCVALALAAENPFVRVVAVDVDPAAAEVARRNAARLGLGARIDVVTGDLLGGLGEERRFDVIVSNPPYVPAAEYEALEPNVRDHEPRLALYGGEDGLDVYRRLIPAAARALEPHGVLAVEVGAGQADAVSGLLAGTRLFEPAALRADLAGMPRVVSARRAPAADRAKAPEASADDMQ